jgi:hypothetical protein
MTNGRMLLSIIISICATACSNSSNGQDGGTENKVVLRDLATRTSSLPSTADELRGDLISTPSDTRSRYYLLRSRKPLLRDSHVALIRQELNSRVAYARIEVDCSKRLLHVLGVGNRRAFAETAIAYDGPLRSIEGLPLREELATFICKTAGTPLAST